MHCIVSTKPVEQQLLHRCGRPVTAIFSRLVDDAELHHHMRGHLFRGVVWQWRTAAACLIRFCISAAASRVRLPCLETGSHAPYPSASTKSARGSGQPGSGRSVLGSDQLYTGINSLEITLASSSSIHLEPSGRAGAPAECSICAAPAAAAVAGSSRCWSPAVLWL